MDESIPQVETEKQVRADFCWNSRRWILLWNKLLIDARGSACPYDGDCDSCSYFERREATPYYKAQIRAIRKEAAGDT